MQSMEGVEMRIVGKLVFIGLRVLQSKGMWLCMVWLTERRNIYRYPAPSPLSTWEGLPLDWRHTTVDTFSSKKCASDFCSNTASRGLLNFAHSLFDVLWSAISRSTPRGNDMSSIQELVVFLLHQNPVLRFSRL